MSSPILNRHRLHLILAINAVFSLGLGCGEEKPWTMAGTIPATRRTLAQGAVVGGEGRYESYAWLGIPFAAPPTGDLRWRAPQPPAAWTGDRTAITMPSACPQFPSPFAGVEDAKPDQVMGNEDCLYLNIWGPRFTAEQVPKGKDLLPVMFWIHGGGNSIGRSAFYEGGHLAAAQKTIVVATQYRLGPLGWFHNAAIRDGQTDPAEQSGNFGILDLIQSLKWVHENIAAFGGDPDNVTIFGESAGGQDVFALLLAPQAKGLFHRAIAESGGLSQTTIDLAERFQDEPQPGHSNSSNEVIARLIQRQGLAKDPASAHAKLASMAPREIASLLRSKTAEEILQLYSGSVRTGMIDMPLVFQDGTVLPEGDWIEKLAQPGGWNQVPVILGSNRDEAKLFLFFDPHRIHMRFGLFPRYVDEDNYLATAEYLSRTWKATSVDRPADAMLRSGAKDVWVYRFDWHDEPRIGGSDLANMVGAAHGFELPFVFGHFDLGKMAQKLYPPDRAPSRNQLSSDMQSYWSHFAKTGDPGKGNAGGLPAWERWTADPATPRFVSLDIPPSGIRMLPGGEVEDDIIADIDRDHRLPTQLDKCRVFHDLAGWTHGLSKASYATAGKNGCSAFPYEGYPWGKKDE